MDGVKVDKDTNNLKLTVMKTMIFSLVTAILVCVALESSVASNGADLGGKSMKLKSYSQVKHQLKKMRNMRVKESKTAGRYFGCN